MIESNLELGTSNILNDGGICGLSLINHFNNLRLLRVRIISVSGIIKKDGLVTCHLYCKLSLYKNNKSTSIVGTSVKTKTTKNTLKPRWTDEFLFRVNAAESKLLIELYDGYKLGRDVYKGCVSINLSELDICTEAPSVTLDPKSYKLSPKKPNSTSKGSLLIYLAYLPLDTNLPPPLPKRLHLLNNDTSQSMEVSSQSDETDAVNPLPNGWAERVDQNGRTFYVDHTSRRTQWVRPTITQLPKGWKERVDDNGRVYYVNQSTNRSQWTHPSSPSENPTGSTASDITEAASRCGFLGRNVNSQFEPATDLSLLQSSTETEAAEMFRRRQQITHEDMLFYRAQSKTRHGRQGAKSRTDEILPGWEIARAPNGHRYYINHNNRTTTWDDPRSERSRSKSVSMPSVIPPSIQRTSSRDDLLGNLGPLPPGWEEREHTDGRIFFVNHNKRTTQWHDPRLNKPGGPAVPYSRSYKQKYEYFRSKLREPQETNTKFEIKVKRKSILEDSYRSIISVKSIEMLKYKLWIDFIGEKGLDYGGVQREWFYLLSREMFNPYYGLFEYSATDNYTLQINPLSGVANEHHLNYFKFIGRVIGMAVYHGRLLDGFFIRPIYKMMLGKKITLKDMESVDLEYYRSLMYILDNDPEDLNLVFSMNEERYGETTEIELVTGGKNKAVTQENKNKYIDCIINWRFVKRVQHQMKAFLEGFQDVISVDALTIFDANELELLLCGLQDINILDWKTNTNYKGDYTDEHPTIINFWKIVHTFNNELRARLLQFVTGTSRVPMNGFGELWGSTGRHKFTIEKWGTTEQLPRAHTCFNRLDLPEYSTFDELRTKLLFAIENTEGFEGVD